MGRPGTLFAFKIIVNSKVDGVHYGPKKYHKLVEKIMTDSDQKRLNERCQEFISTGYGNSTDLVVEAIPGIALQFLKRKPTFYTLKEAMKRGIDLPHMVYHEPPEVYAVDSLVMKMRPLSHSMMVM